MGRFCCATYMSSKKQEGGSPFLLQGSFNVFHNLIEWNILIAGIFTDNFSIFIHQVKADAMDHLVVVTRLFHNRFKIFRNPIFNFFLRIPC